MISHSDTEHGMHAHEMWHRMKQVVTYLYNTLLLSSIIINKQMAMEYLVMCIQQFMHTHALVYRLINQQ